MDQGDVPSADEILTFASIHGDFVCISDRIFRRFEIILPPESRLEVLKDALLEVVHLEREGSGGGGSIPTRSKTSSMRSSGRGRSYWATPLDTPLRQGPA